MKTGTIGTVEKILRRNYSRHGSNCSNHQITIKGIKRPSQNFAFVPDNVPTQSLQDHIEGLKNLGITGKNLSKHVSP